METIRPDQHLSASAIDAEDCKALVRRMVDEAVNRGHFALLEELLAPRLESNLSGTRSRDEVQAMLTVYREAVPDAHWRIEGQLADGDMVATSFVATGTQTGPLWGLPATGKAMSVTGTVFCRCREGRIAGFRLQLDLLGLMQQLGVMPELRLEHEVLVARLVQGSALQ